MSYSVVFRETTANVNADPIVVGDLSEQSAVARKDWIALI